MTEFTITITGYTLKVVNEVNWQSFKRFRIIGRNKDLTLEKFFPDNKQPHWRLVGDKPSTPEGEKALEEMKRELEGWIGRNP